jgi:predicted acyltransferase
VGAAAPVGKQIRPAGVVRIPARLVSLDAFRGFIMILLAAHGFGLAALARRPADSPVWKIFDADRLKWVAFHFDHPPWQSSFVPGTHDATVGDPWLHVGVSFWDLIQPAFMFMVGVAMPFSYARREKTGASALGRGWHALTRAAMLVLLGVFLYSLGKQSTNWIFPNVLAQIGLGYFFVYLLLGRKLWVQVGALVVILAGSWAAIHLTPPPANYEPAQVGAKYELGEVYLPPYRQWSKNGNAFSTFDAWFLNQFPRSPDEGPFTFNRGGYTTLNFVPSMATMLLGVLCGQLLLSPISPGRKLGTLVLLALVCWGLGVAAGATCCPVVKRVWTPGWALFSGGYVIGMLALFYLLFDIAPFRFLAFPLVVVGMNSLLVYVLGELLTGWLAENVNRHLGWAVDAGLGWLANTFQLLKNLDVPPAEAGAALHNALRPTVDATLAAGAIWLICLWLYRQKAFLRI